MSSNRIICTECSNIFTHDDLLKGANPFDDREIIYGCPHCKSIDSTALMCEVEGCKRLASCRTPTPDGYAQTCDEHNPKGGGTKEAA